ncbi:hypothetical protein CG394_06575 [Gardnerella vaginalis]|uniref:Uncharacterized protein n=1 Tax=Gardnerella vaginalis (strain ATCC 14019 / 317) TaxID=525284 RepID=E3DAK1_GARV3|nr:hypothetical protein HMPREF0421_21013 [Gardnerella vaginalis ATCC 14019]RFT22490.1 hypothetical protein CG394_06575 [Gardnerella vaginalis]TCH81116.1 hypothetical protein E0E48_02680 [Gardnerella vaginalis]TCH82359.1 hypothetical protein E0E46_03500 [Gardnerella vaginalis ATCC 14018 = JCM 11026]
MKVKPLETSAGFSKSLLASFSAVYVFLKPIAIVIQPHKFYFAGLNYLFYLLSIFYLFIIY